MDYEYIFTDKKEVVNHEGVIDSGKKEIPIHASFDNLADLDSLDSNHHIQI
jgi:acyl carrier protein